MKVLSNPYIIWGSAGHAKVLADLIGIMGAKVIAIFDNDETVGSCLPKVPIFHGHEGLKEWVDLHGGDGVNAVIAIGGSRGQARLDIAIQLKSYGISLPSLIHPGAAVASTVSYGEGCQILANSVVAADCKLGRHVIINNSANVDHECELGDGVHVAPGAVLCGCINVGHNSMIGAGASILPRIHIGERAIVGAGAVVTSDVPPGTIVVGNPARKLTKNKITENNAND